MQARLYYFYNALVDFINAFVTFDCDHTQRLACGDFAILVVDAAIEQLIFALEAILVLVFTGIARVAIAGAVERSLEVWQQQQSEVRLEVLAHCGVQLQDDLAAQLAASALIRFR